MDVQFQFHVFIIFNMSLLYVAMMVQSRYIIPSGIIIHIS